MFDILFIQITWQVGIYRLVCRFMKMITSWYLSSQTCNDIEISTKEAPWQKMTIDDVINCFTWQVDFTKQKINLEFCLLQKKQVCRKFYPVGIYLLKVNNRNTWTKCKIWSKLIMFKVNNKDTNVTQLMTSSIAIFCQGTSLVKIYGFSVSQVVLHILRLLLEEPSAYSRSLSVSILWSFSTLSFKKSKQFLSKNNRKSPQALQDLHLLADSFQRFDRLLDTPY